MLADSTAWLVALPPALALLIYSVEVAFGIIPLPRSKEPTANPSIAVLIPAHNEELSIEGTINSLATNSLPVRIIVVADNCTDGTAAIAAKAGAECVLRNNSSRRGKGYALACGREFLAQDPPDVVIVLDADCRIDPNSLQTIASAAYRLDGPVQARNLLVAPDGAAPLVQISNFAMLVKNLVRARGLYRIGGGIPLFGTGMAFPWNLFCTASLATADTVEDLLLAIRFARQGVAVHLIEQAHVLSASAAAEDTIGQRRRWEHGFIRTASRQALPLLANGLRHHSRHQVALAFHLCVPPLAMLLAVGSGCVAVALGLGFVSGNFAPAALLAGCLALSLCLTMLAWWASGRSTLAPKALLTVPMYVLAKLPMYLGGLRSRHDVWNRTRRPGEHD